jgi:hypothetical protein
MRSLTFERSTSMRLKEPFLIAYWALYGAGGSSIARRSVADDLEELSRRRHPRKQLRSMRRVVHVALGRRDEPQREHPV